jgi:Ni,Fe-hydrogenase III component G
LLGQYQEKLKRKKREIKEQQVEIEKEQREQKVEKIKKEPPYEVGDIIGYSTSNLPEVYVGEVVLYAKWGNKKGEIPENIESIHIKDNAIYLVTDISREHEEGYFYVYGVSIHKFDENSKYIEEIKIEDFAGDVCIDNKENVYIYNFKKETIRKYDNKAKLIEEYRFPKGFKENLGYYSKMWIKNNDIFIGADYIFYKIGDIKEGFLSSPKKEVYRFRSEKAEIEYTPRPDLEKDFNEICLEVKKRGESKGVIRLKIPKEFPEFLKETTPEEKHELEQIIGIDEDGYIYVLVKDYIYPLYYIKYSPWTIYKYNFEGRLMAEIKLIGPGWPAAACKNEIIIDQHGNIYQLRNYHEDYETEYGYPQQNVKSGVYLIKWKIQR